MATETESKEATKQVVCEPAIIKAPQMSSWNDSRLDELSARTDKGFTDVRQEMRDGFTQIDKRFKKVDQEFKAVRQEMHDGFEKVDKRFEKVEGEVKKASKKSISGLTG
jgi:archaellum component FlaC